MEIDEPEPDYLVMGAPMPDIDWDEERKAAKARLVADEDVEEHLSEVEGGYEHLETLAALLRKFDDGQASPFPGRIYPTGSVTGIPRAV